MNYRKVLLASVFFFLIYFLPQNIFSDSIEKANEYYEKYDYKFAIEIYEKIMQKKPTLEIAQKLANCYRFINNSEAEEKAYARVLSFERFEPVNYKYYADALKQNSRYALAKQNYLLYGQKVPDQAADVEKFANSCDVAQMWAENPDPNIQIENQLALNSAYSEFSPIKYKSGYVFVSDRWFVKNGDSKDDKEVYGWTGNPYLKLYEVETPNLKVPKLTVMPRPLNNQYNTGPAVFTADGDTIYFSRSEADESKKGKVIGRNYIYYSIKEGTEWKEPELIPFNKDGSFSVEHPALSPDGNLLYFASDMPGGFGKMDIYVSRKKSDGIWGAPVNCGANINSIEDEAFPTVKSENEFYFSSKGHIGMGGLDIFSSKGSYNEFSVAENLKAPINSSKDDFGILFMDTEGGFISSNRKGGRGLDDLYSFKHVSPVKAEKLVLAVVGQVVDKTYGSPMSGMLVNLINTNTGQQVPAQSDEMGRFNFQLDEGQDYIVKGDDERFFTRQEGKVSTKNIKESTIFNMRFELERSDATYLVRLNNIHYDFNKWNIRPDAASELSRVVKFMNATSNVNIEMRSHTDSRGTEAYNLWLSRKRAESAADYLRNNGINSSRYTAIGLGETELLNHCVNGFNCSPAEHQENRRTEFKVVKVKPTVDNLTAGLAKK